MYLTPVDMSVIAVITASVLNLICSYCNYINAKNNKRNAERIEEITTALIQAAIHGDRDEKRTANKYRDYRKIL